MGFEEVGTHEALKLIVTKPDKLRAYARDEHGRRRRVRRLGAYWKHVLMEGEIGTEKDALTITFKGRVPKGTVAIDICAPGQKLVGSIELEEPPRRASEVEFYIEVLAENFLEDEKPWFRPGTVGR